MDLYLFALIAACAVVLLAIHKLGETGRRRRRAWAAYYDGPRGYRPGGSRRRR